MRPDLRRSGCLCKTVWINPLPTSSSVTHQLSSVVVSLSRLGFSSSHSLQSFVLFKSSKMSLASSLLKLLVARDTCNYIQVASGDGCWALAQKCGISQDDLTTYNPSPFSCDTIQVGDYVCCSAGSPPDFSPQQDSNGNCASYTVQADDTCSSIASAHSIKDWHKIENVNNQTWAWSGCSLIQVGQNICLSEGTPPFPASVQGTVCGPQVRVNSRIFHHSALLLTVCRCPVPHRQMVPRLRIGPTSTLAR